MISIALAAYSPSAEQAKKAVNFSRSIDEVMAFLINHLVGPQPHLVYGRSAQDSFSLLPGTLSMDSNGIFRRLGR